MDRRRGACASWENTMTKQHRPKVSIGLPVYNGEDFLSCALDALLKQTYSDFELIISDNASIDGTEAICRDYAARDGRIRYVRQDENRGIAWNFNEVFRLSQGRYFKWAAHDDLCDTTFLARSVDILDGDSSVGVCSSRAALIDEHGDLIGVIETGSRSSSLYDARPHRRFADILLHCICLTEFYGLVRAEILRATGLYGSYNLADKVLVAELALHGRILVLPEVLHFWRQHEKQFTRVADVNQRAMKACPHSARKFSWPYRTESTCGYCAAILRARLGFLETVLCMVMVARYLFQLRKWPRVIREAMTGRTPWKIPIAAQPQTLDTKELQYR